MRPSPSGPPTAAPAALSPMMVQYQEAKAAHPDCLVFFRMGDFYELFFDDAVVAAGLLDLALTRRSDVPMAGVPERSHEGYLARLTRAGYKVAICEQMESPAEAKKRGGKPLLRRDVIRVITPGTITEDGLLDARRRNWLAALAAVGGGAELGLAYADITTGALVLEPIDAAGLTAALARVAPSEILVGDRLAETLAAALADHGDRLTVLPTSRFDSDNGRRRLEALFKTRTLAGFGAFGRAEVAAAGALVDYVALTQKGRMPSFERPRRLAAGDILEIDAATRRNLELMRSLDGGRRGSLLAAVDRTVTGAGGRLLADHLAAPLTDIAAIDRRLDAVSAFVADGAMRGDLRRRLGETPDLERALGRLSLGRGLPRDLAAVRDGLAAAVAIRGLLGGPGRSALPPLVAALAEALPAASPLAETLAAALAPDLPALMRDGGVIARGHHEPLDHQRALRDEGRRLIAGLQARYAEATGVAALKVRHNHVLGYFVEVTPAHADRLATAPHDRLFVHRQTLANQVRFTTAELGDLEQAIAEAGDRALALEQQLVEALVARILADAPAVSEAARALAALDVAAAQAELAVAERYCRPVVEDGLAFHVEGGRHPVVEQTLAAAGEGFVANDCDLSARGGAPDAAPVAADGAEPGGRLWLLTGPNMAGKSTFLRQNALIALMAQAGGYVPAKRATIGVVDRLFSRVGAADDLARGRSTFMVEMVETAVILNQATRRSLVILDEIGRGTATFDGLSIAWATIEHLHEAIGCRALFATHYHELTQLAEAFAEVVCHTMRVREWRGDIVFLHEVRPGAADRSYGIHVARLAGLPATVTERAQAVLTRLEEGRSDGRPMPALADLPLFQAAPPRPAPAAPPGPSPAEARLAAVSPDSLSPREALDLVYALKDLLAATDGGPDGPDEPHGAPRRDF